MSKRKDAPFGRLRYLYMGTSNVQKDVDYYTKVLGARKIWDISSFGTRVAALRLGEGPLFLLADHRPAPSCILIFQVDDLRSEEHTSELQSRPHLVCRLLLEKKKQDLALSHTNITSAPMLSMDS